MKNRFKDKRSILFLLVLMTLSLVMIPPAAHAKEEVGECELALGRCVQYVMFLGYNSDTMINCLIGYAFCKKYVESC